MKNKGHTGLGSAFYMEWLFLPVDYLCTLRRSEAAFELLCPAVVSIVCTLIYARAGKLFVALDGLVDLLPTAVSLLIGFTVMLITLLLTSSGDSIDKLKKLYTEKELHDKKVTLFQSLHIQFSYSLFSEVLLLLSIFFYLFIKGLATPFVAGIAFLFVEIFLTLNILLSILRGITNLYFSFNKS